MAWYTPIPACMTIWESDVEENIGKLNRRCFSAAHSNTVYVQPLFGELPSQALGGGVFAYPPCWAILDPGMTVETHRHPIPEFYVFVQGSGSMVLGSETIPVAKGTAVNILPKVDHGVSNDRESLESLVWVSIGLET